MKPIYIIIASIAVNIGLLLILIIFQNSANSKIYDLISNQEKEFRAQIYTRIDSLQAQRRIVEAKIDSLSSKIDTTDSKITEQIKTYRNENRYLAKNYLDAAAILDRLRAN
jgi:peptidoglycan hydrolase CwlO-like protein